MACCLLSDLGGIGKHKHAQNQVAWTYLNSHNFYFFSIRQTSANLHVNLEYNLP